MNKQNISCASLVELSPPWFLIAKIYKWQFLVAKAWTGVADFDPVGFLTEYPQSITLRVLMIFGVTISLSRLRCDMGGYPGEGGMGGAGGGGSGSYSHHHYYQHYDHMEKERLDETVRQRMEQLGMKPKALSGKWML